METLTLQEDYAMLKTSVSLESVWISLLLKALYAARQRQTVVTLKMFVMAQARVVQM